MGVILSNIEEIENIRWETLKKGRVQKAVKILSIEDGVAIVELANGSFTVIGRRHSPNGNWAVMGYGLDMFTGSVLDGLVKIGILTKENVSDHKKRQKEREYERSKNRAKKDLINACNELGIKIPNEVEDIK